jgi:hypothetical protein
MPGSGVVSFFLNTRLAALTTVQARRYDVSCLRGMAGGVGFGERSRGSSQAACDPTPEIRLTWLL